MYRLLEAGYGSRMMLSHDWSVLATMMSKELLAQRTLANPDNYLFITRNVLPMLLEPGATQDQVDGLMIDNPRRFFEGNT
jgi:phosphotriesterase-related protein